MKRPEDILDFWFGDLSETAIKRWFIKNEAFDEEIKENFGSLVEEALAGKLDSWGDTKEGALALIIVLDQFTRNVYRDTPQSFVGDEAALKWTLVSVEKGFDQATDLAKRCFFYYPFMHSEEEAMQEKSISFYKQLKEGATPDVVDRYNLNYDYAVAHADIIKKYGRYPHRNDILGRESTPEEIEFLKKPGSRF